MSIFLKLFIVSFFLICTSNMAFSQQGDMAELRQEVLEIKADVELITLNLEKSKAKFQKGIFIATLGYTVTIIGGLMLGRDNDELGQVLLVTGGVTGGIGTYMLVDAFKYLGRVRRRPKG